ncbi:hypothetical protein ACTXGL_01555 [Psychrobacter sp. T6-6]|uniref:hypothetical protein n=1 Tax=Psychrobacter sp. T6-6 TaxID=3457452 RepID=UPI003FD048DB
MDNVQKLLLQLDGLRKQLKLSGYSKLNSHLQHGISSDNAATKFDAFMVVRDEVQKMQGHKTVQINSEVYHACGEMICLCNEALIYYALKGVGRESEVHEYEGCFDNILALVEVAQ